MVSRFQPFEGLLILAVTMDAVRKLVLRLSFFICGCPATVLVECLKSAAFSQPSVHSSDSYE